MQGVAVDPHHQAGIEPVGRLAGNMCSSDGEYRSLDDTAPEDEKLQPPTSGAAQVFLCLVHDGGGNGDQAQLAQDHAGGSPWAKPTICGVRLTLYPVSGRSPYVSITSRMRMRRPAPDGRWSSH